MNAFIMVVNDVDLDEPMVEEKRKVTSAVINEEKGTAGIGEEEFKEKEMKGSIHT